MKRLGIFVSLLLLFSSPTLLSARIDNDNVVYVAEVELPWSTVDAVLKRVALLGNYAYSDLVAGYHGGTVTVVQSGSSYVVTIYGVDGASDQVIIDNM